MTLKTLMKEWTLPLSMVVGAICYVMFTRIDALCGAKHVLLLFIPYFLPLLIFCMLFFTYCKIDPKDMKPKLWHLWLVLIQMAETALAVWWCISHPDSEWKPLVESLLACFIAPMAAVGAVVTQKIGGNPATATTYTIISSTMTAIVVPLVYPLVEPGLGMTFWEMFLRILSRVFPTIMAPLVISYLMYWFMPKTRECVAEKSKDYSFYLWGICTMVNTAQIIRSIVSSPGSSVVVLYICFCVGLLVFMQFYVGKQIGSRYDDRIAAGQGLAQKNTVLAIWMAMMYLDPQAAIGPGACLLWQNMVNSWQIWRHGKTA